MLDGVMPSSDLAADIDARRGRSVNRSSGTSRILSLLDDPEHSIAAASLVLRTHWAGKMGGDEKSTIAEELDKMLADGPGRDIFRAEEALGITDTIGRNADAVNASDFKLILVALQSYAIETFILAINKLFDRRRQNYQLLSLPAIVAFALEHVEELPPQQPWHHPTLERIGVSLKELDAADGPIATAIVMRAVQTSMPTPESDAGLNALKAIRDKQLAHPEQVEAEQLPQATWEQAERLLELAKDVTGILGACTATGYVAADGDYLGTYDSEMTLVNLRRMLRQIGIGDAD